MSGNTFLLFLIIFASILLGYYLGALTRRAARVVSTVSAQSKRKAEKKARVLELLREKRQVKNNDIEQLLGVSDATATRYLDELEREDKIVQHGESKGTFYTLK